MKLFTFCILALLAAASTAQPPQVVSLTPAGNSLSAHPTSDIIVDFAGPLDPVSVADNFHVFGRWSGPAAGSVLLENGDTRIRFVSIEPFFAGEFVTVSLTRKVLSAPGDSLLGGYSFGFWIRTLPGTLQLIPIDTVVTRLEGEGLLQLYGAYAGDINNDGYTDFTGVNESSNDLRVFLNDGAGNFGPFTIFNLPGGQISPNSAGDFDGDGEIDLAVGTTQSDQLHVVMGDGTGGYAPPVSYTSGLRVRGVATLDLDADGDADLATSNYTGNFVGLLLNNGDGTFAAVDTVEAGSSGEWSLAAADANNDGITDLFVGCQNSREISILLGDGNGGMVFSDKIYINGYTWMLAAGDVNGDGNVDVVSANSASNTASVVLCNGAGGFLSVTNRITGTFPLAIDLGDIDGDGDLDMTTSNYSSADYSIFRNNGNGSFTMVGTLPASSAGSCTILHDRDNDGDMDISGIDELDDLIFIYDNNCCKNRGNVDSFFSMGNPIDISDLTYLVDYLFSGGAAPPCPLEGNVDGLSDGDLGITITDLTYLVDYLFGGGAAPPAC